MKPHNYEELWEIEIGRRIADLDSGKEKTIPWEEVSGTESSEIATFSPAQSASEAWIKEGLVFAYLPPLR